MNNISAPAQFPHNPVQGLSDAKLKLQQTWASGDYAQVGSTLQIVGEMLAEAVDLRPGQQVLDVAAGNGNFSLAAARRFAQVTSTDLVPQLLEKGRIRALAEGFDIRFQPADVEALPMPNQSFDVVASTFGVMFAPDQPKAAREMQRVCRKGGKLALANWTPDSFIGQLLGILRGYLPSNQASPLMWGDQDHLREMFAVDNSSLHVNRCHFIFRYHSPAQWLQNFKAVYGPLRGAFAALDEQAQNSLMQDLMALLERLNQATDGSLWVPGAYLQVVLDNH